MSCTLSLPTQAHLQSVQPFWIFFGKWWSVVSIRLRVSSRRYWPIFAKMFRYLKQKENLNPKDFISPQCYYTSFGRKMVIRSHFDAYKVCNIYLRSRNNLKFWQINIFSTWGKPKTVSVQAPSHLTAILTRTNESVHAGKDRVHDEQTKTYSIINVWSILPPPKTPLRLFCNIGEWIFTYTATL